MKFRKVLLCGVAAGALGLAAALPDGTLPNLAPPAEAQVQASVSVGFGTFYDRLSPHGDWVRYEGRHVWVPTSVEDQWRPYTVGRWVYTNPHGWTWVSDEPFSWAVYHYGRWGFHHTIGWYWVPDTEWAPAWVTWRSSGDHVAWAPMPPRGAVEVSYDVDPYAVPARYWVAVPTQRFLAPNIFSVALHPWQPRFYDVVRYTRPVGHVRVVNDISVNTYINVNYIERQTGEQVRVHRIRQLNEPTSTQVEDDAVALFAPAVEEETDAEPQQVRTVEEVTERRQAEAPADAPEDAQLDEPVQVAEDAPEVPEEAVAEEPAPVSDEDVAEDAPAEGEEPAADVAEDTPAEGEEPAADVAEDAPAEGEEPAADVAEDTPAEDEEPAADVAEDMPAEDEEPAADVAEDAPAADEEPAAEVTEDAPAEGEEPATAVTEDTPGEGEESAADAAEEAAPQAEPEADVVEDEPTAPEPPAAAAPEAEPEADVAEDEPAPDVGERAIGEPAEEAPGQRRGQEEEDE